jgi:hydroxyethylthiazole kinase-like uncharacterized protein yjeF
MHTQLIDESKRYPLLSMASKRAVEQLYKTFLPEHYLMQQAGLKVAQLVQALQPHAHTFWIVCGPGNNGGDGLIAATYLHQKGKNVRVSYCGETQNAPPDAAWALQQALSLGISIEHQIPDRSFLNAVDCIIDAMLGIGASRPLDGLMAQCTAQINQLNCFVLAVDIPSGLIADTGAVLLSDDLLADQATLHKQVVKADATLALIALSVGLFTAYGRDFAGQVWLDELNVQSLQVTDFESATSPPSNFIPHSSVNLYDYSPIAFLAKQPGKLQRAQASHKGSFGSVAVVAGANGMQGAAVLAASAALKAGTGKVYLSFLSELACPHPISADLMLRSFDELELANLTVVCGCGAGQAVAEVLPKVLANSQQLVLDADALNTIAKRDDLKEMLKMRAGLGLVTVLTPHPKEAAHLLNTSLAQVQNNRIYAVQNLANFYNVVVVLKGSGSLIAAPFVAPNINTSGNALLAIAGTGDVLAGMVGAALAQGLSAFEAARTAVYWHGKIANNWASNNALTASTMLEEIPRFYE